MMTYAIGDAKYDRSSLPAIARMLRMLFIPSLRRLLGFVGRHLQEDLFEAHPHRPEFEQSPSALHDRAGQITPHVRAALTFDFEAARNAACVRRNHAAHT